MMKSVDHRRFPKTWSALVVSLQNQIVKQKLKLISLTTSKQLNQKVGNNPSLHVKTVCAHSLFIEKKPNINQKVAP